MRQTYSIETIVAELEEQIPELADEVTKLLAESCPLYMAHLERQRAEARVAANFLVRLYLTACAHGPEELEVWDVFRQMGAERARQGLELDLLCQVMQVYRDFVLAHMRRESTIVSDPESALWLAERRLDHLVERMTLELALGYLDQAKERHREDAIRLSSLYRMARSIASPLSPRHLLDTALAEAVQLLAADAGALWLANPDGSYRLAAQFLLLPQEIAELEQQKMGAVAKETLGATVTGRPLIANLAGSRLPRFGSALGFAFGDPTRLEAVAVLFAEPVDHFPDVESTFVGAVKELLDLARLREHPEGSKLVLGELALPGDTWPLLPKPKLRVAV